MDVSSFLQKPRGSGSKALGWRKICGSVLGYPHSGVFVVFSYGLLLFTDSSLLFFMSLLCTGPTMDDVMFLESLMPPLFFLSPAWGLGDIELCSIMMENKGKWSGGGMEIDMWVRTHLVGERNDLAVQRLLFLERKDR